MSSEECHTSMPQVKKLISSILISNPSKYIPVAELENDYRDLIGSTIPHTKLGFPSLKKFLQSIPDVLEMKLKDGVVVIVPIVNQKVAHIKDMICKQKKSTSRKKNALAFIPPSVRSRKTVHHQPHHDKRRSHHSSQSDNRPTRDLKSGASRKDPSNINKLGNQGETKNPDSTRVMKKPEETHSDVTKSKPSSVKERLTEVVLNKKPVEKKSEDKPGCSNENQPLGKQRSHLSSQSNNAPTRDLKSGALKKDPPDVNKLGNQGQTKERDSIRAMKKPKEARPDVTKYNSSSVKEPLTIGVVHKKPVERKLEDKPGCSREVQNFTTLKVTTNNKTVIENGTKQPVSEKKNCTEKIEKHSKTIIEGISIKQEPISNDSPIRVKDIPANAVIEKGTKRPANEEINCTQEIVKRSKIRTESIATKEEATRYDPSARNPDNTAFRMLQGIKRTIETYEQYMARIWITRHLFI